MSLVIHIAKIFFPALLFQMALTVAANAEPVFDDTEAVAECPAGSVPISVIGGLFECQDGESLNEKQLAEKVKEELGKQLARELNIPLWLARKIVDRLWGGSSIETILELLGGAPFLEIPDDIEQQLRFLAYATQQLKRILARLAALECAQLALMKAYLEAIDDGDGCISIIELVQWIALIDDQQVREILQRLLHRYLTTIAPEGWCELIEQFTGINPCETWGKEPEVMELDW